MILDHAVLVGKDGPTHHGCYDLAYLGCIPNLKIMAPSHEMELRNMVVMCAVFDNGPTILRYPSGTGYGSNKLRDLFEYNIPVGREVSTTGQILCIVKGRTVRRVGENGPVINVLKTYDSPNFGRVA